jgi:hypothetical protein
MLLAVNEVLVKRGINIERQVLDTRGDLGYAIYEINQTCDEGLIRELEQIPGDPRLPVREIAAQDVEGLPQLPSKAGLPSRSCRLLAQLVLQQFVRKITARKAETARRLRLGTAGRLQGALDQSLFHSRK